MRHLETINYDIHDPAEWSSPDYGSIKKGKERYRDSFGAFDIETSRIDELTYLYCWSYTDITGTYFGRTWSEFQTLFDSISSVNDDIYVIYVHNLNYEMQFLQSILDVEQMFAVKKRKPVKFRAGNIEFRCSYRLTNMSLAKFCESEEVDTVKLEGYDHDKVRYPDTELSDFEISYSCMDTISLYNSLVKLMSAYDDNVVTIPLTSTGYVRRDARAVMCNQEERKLFIRQSLSTEQYKLCSLAVRGGDTHANYLYVGSILSDVRSYDRSSSYPHVMLTCKYPVGKFIEETPGARAIPPEGLACIMVVEFIGIELNPDRYFPYISVSKCMSIKGLEWSDNGRVVKADYVLMVITEIDYWIIVDEYTFGDCRIIRWMLSEIDYLPKAYRTFVLNMYMKKCELKGVDDYYYQKYKNKLNSTFGMMLTSVVREEVGFDQTGWTSVLPDYDKALHDYYRNSKSFLSYQHGIYVTAHARAALRKAINLVGQDGVYVDTDSMKYIGVHDFEALNSVIHTANMKCDIPPVCTVNGKTYEMGLWEDESKCNSGVSYSEFITWGAKKYAYRYPDGNYGITISGVSKSKGSDYISEHGLDSLVEGSVFDYDKSGRLTAKFDDARRYIVRYIDGHMIEETSNVSLLPTTYTLGQSREYKRYLEMFQKGV